MKAVLTSNDPVRTSWAQSVLSEAGIESFLLDAHMSAMEGSIGVLPRRLCVLDEDKEAALSAIQHAETTIAVDQPSDEKLNEPEGVATPAGGLVPET